jgi:hypothetical protein
LLTAAIIVLSEASAFLHSGERMAACSPVMARFAGSLWVFGRDKEALNQLKVKTGGMMSGLLSCYPTHFSTGGFTGDSL